MDVSDERLEPPPSTLLFAASRSEMGYNTGPPTLVNRIRPTLTLAVLSRMLFTASLRLSMRLKPVPCTVVLILPEESRMNRIFGLTSVLLKVLLPR